MADAKDSGKYKQGGGSEETPWDTVGQNPTGRKRKSSAGQRRKKLGKLLRGQDKGKK